MLIVGTVSEKLNDSPPRESETVNVQALPESVIVALPAGKPENWAVQLLQVLPLTGADIDDSLMVPVMVNVVQMMLLAPMANADEPVVTNDALELPPAEVTVADAAGAATKIAVTTLASRRMMYLVFMAGPCRMKVIMTPSCPAS